MVLVNPSHPGNIGAAARAMANCGLTHMVVVGTSWKTWPDDAFRMASGADEILHSAIRVASVEEALVGSVLAAATTGRLRADKVPIASHREAAPRILEAARIGPVSILFGPEDKGLTAEDLALCALRITIPTSDLHRSLNLAQAVLLVGHELFASGESQETSSDSSTDARATVDEIQALFGQFQNLLCEVGFVTPRIRTMPRGPSGRYC
jgi:TrmH family RNA methyltransferase